MDLLKDTQLVSVNPCSEYSAQIALPFFFFFNNFYLFVFGCLLLHRLFISFGERGLLSGCNAWASQCGGFSCGMGGSRAQAQ